MKRILAIIIFVAALAPQASASETILGWLGAGSYTPAASAVPEMDSGIAVSAGALFPVAEYAALIIEFAGCDADPKDDRISGDYFFGGTEAWITLGPTETVFQPSIGIGVGQYDTHFSMTAPDGTRYTHGDYEASYENAGDIQPTIMFGLRGGLRLVMGPMFVEGYAKVIAHQFDVTVTPPGGTPTTRFRDMGGTVTGINIGTVFSGF